MKYTIELTDRQRKRFKHMNKALIKMGMGFDILSLLEPIKTTNVEDTNEYQIGYKTGYDKGYYDGYDKCLHSSANDDYEKGKLDGLEDGYKGYKYLNQWFTDNCFLEDEDNLFPEYKRRQADTCCLEDIITDVGFSEVLNRVKAYEEKKKADAEIKVGDEVMYLPNDTKFYVIAVSPERYKGLYYAEYNKYLPITICDLEKDECKKTGRHIDEISQLLDKLRGE